MDGVVHGERPAMRYLFGLLLLSAIPALAQPPIDTSFLHEYAETRGFMLGRPQKPQFSPDGKTVLFLRSPGRPPALQSLYETNLTTGKTRLLLSPQRSAEHLTPEEKARRERQRDLGAGFANFSLDRSGTHVLVTLGGLPYVLDRHTDVAEVLPVAGPVLDPRWSPDGHAIAYVRNHDLWVYHLDSRKEEAATTGGTLERTHGEAEFVAQEEMQRFTGYWWAPDSRSLAYEEADYAGVEVWNIADPLSPEQTPLRQYYPRPGHKNVAVRLGVVTLGKPGTTWVDWDHRRYEYLAAVTWSKFGPLTLQLQDRAQHELDFYRADPSGATHLLLQQHNPAWVNIFENLPVWLPDGKRFVCVLEVGGHERVCLVDGQVKTVLGPSDELNAVVGVDVKRGVVYALSSSSPGTENVRVLSWDGPLPAPKGNVSALAFARGHRALALTLHSMHALPVIKVGSLTLPSVAVEPELKLHVQFVALTGLNAAVVRPRDFDPDKHYPVIVKVYGGPHHLEVVRSKGSWLVDQWLANQGFVVVSVDNRGTPGRGRAFETSVYGKFGSVPLDDQVEGLQELGRRFPELDLTRVGITGWSFGGYMSALAVLKRPDIFKAAVAGAPVTDWEDYDSHYTERYLGTLPEHRADYDAASLIPMAKDLSRPLLLVHGTADDNVYYRHSLKLSQALLRAGKPFELMSLPGITHLYTHDSVITERVWFRAATFFRAHLGSPQ